MRFFRALTSGSRKKERNEFHLEPRNLINSTQQDERSTDSQAETHTTFRAVPIHSIDVVGRHRTWEAYRYFNDIVKTEERLVKIGKQFGRLGFVLQSQLLKTIPTITERTKQVFVEITTTCAVESMTDYRYCRPARLVSALMGCPDEEYDDACFVNNVLKPFGERFRDWEMLSTADLFATRAELVGSLHYFTPWGQECYAVFDIDPTKGTDVLKERERKQHVFMTNVLARKVLYKYSTELRLLYNLVDDRLSRCSAVLEKYSLDRTVLPYEEHGVYQ